MLALPGTLASVCPALSLEGGGSSEVLTWGPSSFTHSPSLHTGLWRCPLGRGARRQTPARDRSAPSDAFLL